MNAQCIMVCSGKGGTGKSTVSVLLGACLARLGRKVLLIELDSGLRSVDIIAGVYGRTVYDIEDVLCGRCEGAKAVVPSPLYPGLSVISAPYEGGAVEAAPLGRLLTAMRPYFDFILLDTAAGMGAPFTAAAAVADKALLVLTPDAVALRDGKIVADRLLAGTRPQSAVRLVMNRVRRESFGKNASVADLDECIDTVGAQLLAVIPESRILQLAGANGELDIVSIKDIPGYANLINLGVLEPLNTTLDVDASKFNGIIEQLTADDGNYYAVPFISSFWVVYYNKDIFDANNIEYPTNDMTMEQWDAKIREVSEKTGVYGNIYHTWRSTVSLFGILDGKNTIIDGNYDFLKPYYEQVLSEQADGVIPNYGEQKTSGLHYSGAFQNGQAAMCNMGSWFIATMQKYNEEPKGNGVEPVNFGIVKYPHPDGAPAGSTLGTVTSLAINANSTKKEAAADFLNWCASEEAAEALAATGNFPAVSSDKTSEIIASTDGFPNDENSKEALKTTAVYLEMPLSDKASEIETILNTEHDAIMTESETVDEGIANMNEQVQALLG